MIPFSEWLPDLPDYQNPGSTRAKNVIPGAISYLPMKEISVFSNALGGPCRGAFSGRDTSGVVYTYAGDASQLYSLTTSTFGDVSRSGTGSTAYSLGTTESWEFTQFGNTVLATHIDDELQGIDMGSTNFSNVISSTLKPQARHIGVVRGFVVLGNTREGGTNHPQRVRWSAFNDATDFDADVTTQSDAQDLLGDGADIQRVVGGQTGIIFQRFSIWKMTYIGSPLFFQFDEIEKGRGAYVPGGVIRYGEMIFFLDVDGFYLMNARGGQSQPIGKNKVDRTFFDDLDREYYYNITGAVDPINSLAVWAYPGVGNTGGRPNRLLLFNWSTQRWSLVELEAQLLFRVLTSGFTLEQLDTPSGSDIESLAEPLDSPLWAGGALRFGCFNKDNKLAYFSGSSMDSTVETTELNLNQDNRMVITGVRPVVDGQGTFNVQVGSRNKHTLSTSWGSAISVNRIGVAPVRTNGRYLRFRVNTSGEFNHAQGVEITGKGTGKG